MIIQYSLKHVKDFINLFKTEDALKNIVKTVILKPDFDSAKVFSATFNVRTDREVDYTEKFYKLLEITRCSKFGITKNSEDDTKNLVTKEFTEINFEEHLSLFTSNNYLKNLLNFLYVAGFFLGASLKNNSQEIYELIKDEIDFISLLFEDSVRYYLSDETNLATILKSVEEADISTISDLELDELVLVEGKYYNQKDINKAMTAMAVSALQKEDLEPNVANRLPQTKRKVSTRKRKKPDSDDDKSYQSQ